MLVPIKTSNITNTNSITKTSNINNTITIDSELNILLENKQYITQKDIPVEKAVSSIIDTLNINNEDLQPIVEELAPVLKNKVIKIKKQPVIINKILNNNVRINKLNKHFVNNTIISEKIRKLKNKLSILQFNSMIEKEDKTNILKDVIKTIDNKVQNINTILEQNITQKGGNNETYYYKYLKYKIKYLELLGS